MYLERKSELLCSSSSPHLCSSSHTSFVLQLLLIVFLWRVWCLWSHKIKLCSHLKNKTEQNMIQPINFCIYFDVFTLQTDHIIHDSPSRKSGDLQRISLIFWSNRAFISLCRVPSRCSPAGTLEATNSRLSVLPPLLLDALSDRQRPLGTCLTWLP